ncbi:MAG: hypothetical protein LM589_02705 [Thermosphaera sp.]|nr:hypothetical protein [Thermosphaera sp.]
MRYRYCNTSDYSYWRLFSSSHYGRAPYHAIVGLESSGECCVLVVLENPYAKHEHCEMARVPRTPATRGLSSNSAWKGTRHTTMA